MSEKQKLYRDQRVTLVRHGEKNSRVRFDLDGREETVPTEELKDFTEVTQVSAEINQEAEKTQVSEQEEPCQEMDVQENEDPADTTEYLDSTPQSPTPKDPNSRDPRSVRRILASHVYEKQNVIPKDVKGAFPSHVKKRPP